MITRVLTHTDAATFYHIRRRALHEEPAAFGMMPEEMTSVEALAKRFKDEWSGQHGFVIGGFDSDLIGIVGCVREPRVKRLRESSRVLCRCQRSVTHEPRLRG
jgi:hypothetical protein